MTAERWKAEEGDGAMTEMRCADSIERIARRLEGDLPLDLARELDRHLVSCARCRAEERFQTLLHEALAAPLEAGLSADFTERVVRGAFCASPRRSAPSRAWSLLAPALLASAAAVLWFLLGPALAHALLRGGTPDWIEIFLPLARSIRSAGTLTAGLVAGLFGSPGAPPGISFSLFIVLLCSSLTLVWGVREVRAWLRA